MKKLGLFAVLLSVALFTFGCASEEAPAPATEGGEPATESTEGTEEGGTEEGGTEETGGTEEGGTEEATQ